MERPPGSSEFTSYLALFKRGAQGQARPDELAKVKELLLSNKADYFNHLQLAARASIADEKSAQHGVDLIRLSFSKCHLDFGLNEGQKCNLGKPLIDRVKITNNGSAVANFFFMEDTSRSTVYTLTFTPNTAKLKKGAMVEVVVELRVLCTTRLRELVTLVEGGVHHFFTIRLDSQMSQHLDHSEIAFGPIIGSGGDGIVHKATWRGLEVAVKLISSGPAAVESFCKEIEVHKEMVHHPNIVHFIGYCLVPRCLIFEYIEGGSLDKYLGSSNLSTAFRLKAALDIAQGMAFLHSNDVLHLDLKPQNFLVQSLSLSASSNIKLADFGLSRFAVRSYYGVRVEGSFLYVAPEVLLEKKFSKAADVWSFGACLIEIVSDKKPYSEYDQMNYLELVGKREGGHLPMIPTNCELAVKQLISSCLQSDPAKRLTFVEISSIIGELLARVQDPKSCTQHNSQDTLMRSPLYEEPRLLPSDFTVESLPAAIDNKFAILRSLLEGTLQKLQHRLSLVVCEFEVSTTLNAAVNASKTILALTKTLSLACQTHLSITWDDAYNIFVANSLGANSPQCKIPPLPHFTESKETIIELHKKTQLVYEQAYIYLQLLKQKSLQTQQISDMIPLVAALTWLQKTVLPGNNS